MDAADDIWNMDEFLEETLEVDNADMRDNLQNAGFMNLTTLRNKKWEFADSCCGVVRKGTGGNAATKNVPARHETAYHACQVYVHVWQSVGL